MSPYLIGGAGFSGFNETPFTNGAQSLPKQKNPLSRASLKD
jgi:hypothetical protein